MIKVNIKWLQTVTGMLTKTFFILHADMYLKSALAINLLIQQVVF